MVTRAQQDIGNRIAGRRSQLGLTQHALGVYVGRSRSQIANLERGQTDMPVSLLVTIAWALQVSAAALLGEVPMPDAPPVGYGENPTVTTPGCRCPNIMVHDKPARLPDAGCPVHGSRPALALIRGGG